MPTQAMPDSTALVIAVSAAKVMTTWPRPLSPSMRALTRVSARDGDLGVEIDASRLDPRDVLWDPDQAVTRPPPQIRLEQATGGDLRMLGRHIEGVEGIAGECDETLEANLTARIGPRSPLCRQRSG